MSRSRRAVSLLTLFVVVTLWRPATPVTAGPIMESARRHAARLSAQAQPATRRDIHGEIVLIGGLLVVLGARMVAQAEPDCGASRVSSLSPDACEVHQAAYDVGWGAIAAGGGFLIWGLIGKQVPVSPSITIAREGVALSGGVQW